MTPYLPNIPRRVAHLLAMLEVRDYPSDTHDSYSFTSTELDIDDNEVVIITYERRRKPPTLPVFTAVTSSTVTLKGDEQVSYTVSKELEYAW